MKSGMSKQGKITPISNNGPPKPNTVYYHGIMKSIMAKMKHYANKKSTVI